jgi:hypothetical protein
MSFPPGFPLPCIRQERCHPDLPIILAHAGYAVYQDFIKNAVSKLRSERVVSGSNGLGMPPDLQLEAIRLSSYEILPVTIL